MLENSQSVVVGERFAPLVEQFKGWTDVAGFVGQRIAHFERTLSHFGSLYKACLRQIAQGDAEHLLGNPRDLASKLSKTRCARPDRCQHDGAPATAERRQGDIHAAHIEPVAHGTDLLEALTSW